MLKPNELTAEHLNEHYKKADLEEIAVKDYGLEINHDEKKAALITRILAAASVADEPDEEVEAEDLEETEDTDELAERIIDASKNIPQAPAVKIPAELKDALTPFIRAGLKVRINKDGTFHMQNGAREDTGTLSQPPHVIARCAKRLMA
jgi:hypothetical protein